MSGTSSTVVSVSGAKVASGSTGAVKCPLGAQVAILAAVTAVSGTTPSMTLTVEWSHDGVTFAPVDAAADTFAALTAAANTVKAFAVKGEFFRLVWTITGTTPSFTFAATAYGV